MEYHWVNIRDVNKFANNRAILIKNIIKTLHKYFPKGGYFFDKVVSIEMSKKYLYPVKIIYNILARHYRLSYINSIFRP